VRANPINATEASLPMLYDSYRGFPILLIHVVELYFTVKRVVSNEKCNWSRYTIMTNVMTVREIDVDNYCVIDWRVSLALQHGEFELKQPSNIAVL
jgi:hypothetical protein